MISQADQIVEICELIKVGKTTEANTKIFMYKKSSVYERPYFTWVMALKELKNEEESSAASRLKTISAEPTSIGLHAKKLLLELKSVN